MNDRGETMIVSYTKALNRNYMVIQDEIRMIEESYCYKMLSTQKPEGFLLTDLRSINNQSLYYYDITGRQSLSNLTEKTLMSDKNIKNLFLSISAVLEQVYEFLLNENDIIFNPDQIYQEMGKEEIGICYFPGYHKELRMQITQLLEYLMNRVDYNDKPGVLLVYDLYAVCKEDGFTVQKLVDRISESEVKNNPPIIKKSAKSIHTDIGIEPEIKSAERMEHTPAMMETIESEREVSYFSWETYLYTGLYVLSVITVIVLSLKMKWVHNSLGNRMDGSKLLALFLILGCISGYFYLKIWDKHKRITKLVKTQECIEPEIDSWDTARKSIPSFHIEKEAENKAYSQVEDGQEPTCLLGGIWRGSCLKPLEDSYEIIYLDSFPFFVGKLRRNVDYCLTQDSVSRYHAKITFGEGEYYLTDLNSTNGTYLDGRLLETYQPQRMEEGCEIAFANIKYQFVSQ